jgi:hypothetical protein
MERRAICSARSTHIQLPIMSAIIIDKRTKIQSVLQFVRSFYELDGVESQRQPSNQENKFDITAKFLKSQSNSSEASER